MNGSHFVRMTWNDSECPVRVDSDGGPPDSTRRVALLLARSARPGRDTIEIFERREACDVLVAVVDFQPRLLEVVP